MELNSLWTCHIASAVSGVPGMCDEALRVGRQVMRRLRSAKGPKTGKKTACSCRRRLATPLCSPSDADWGGSDSSKLCKGPLVPHVLGQPGGICPTAAEYCQSWRSRSISQVSAVSSSFIVWTSDTVFTNRVRLDAVDYLCAK